MFVAHARLWGRYLGGAEAHLAEMSKEEKAGKKSRGSTAKEPQKLQRTDSVDRHDDDEGDPVETFDGYLEFKKKKKVGTAWAVMNVILIEGSLFLYVTNTDMLPEKSFDLSDFKVVKGEQGATKFNFTLESTDKKKKEKKPYEFRVGSANERDEWIQRLSDATKKDAVEPPSRQSVERGRNSKLFRAKKKMSGKVAGSAAGMKAIRKLGNGEIADLIDSMHIIVSKTDGAKKADEIEKILIKLFLKAYFQIQEKTLTVDQILTADKPLRSAFNMFDKLFHYYGSRNPEALITGFQKIEADFKEVERILSDLFKPYLQAKNMMNLHNLLAFFGSVEFLKKVWGNKTLEDELFTLVSAMNNYTQFEYHKD